MTEHLCKCCGKFMAKAGPWRSGKNEYQQYMCTHFKDGCKKAGDRLFTKEPYIREGK